MQLARDHGQQCAREVEAEACGGAVHEPSGLRVSPSMFHVLSAGAREQEKDQWQGLRQLSAESQMTSTEARTSTPVSVAPSPTPSSITARSALAGTKKGKRSR